MECTHHSLALRVSTTSVGQDAGVSSPASRYAAGLLTLAGLDPAVEDDSDAVTDWAASGAMALTGRPDGPPLVATGPAVALRGALLALGLDLGLELLGERAALAGFSRQGTTSCGGATRLLPVADGTVAVSLARDDDLTLLPALVEAAVDDPWEAVTSWASVRSAEEVRERGCLLGLAVSVVGEADDGPAWTTWHERSGVPVGRQPVVVDLSSLWAGPLAASLLGMLGCRVLKVEDPRRPDGARRGPRAFFDLLNAGAKSIALDLRGEHGRTALADLVSSADVVLEGSRPRALRQLGIVAEEVVAEHDVTWVSITAHGRGQNRIGFGDDSAAAGGLVVDGCFVGDAVADPLTGVHAALAAWSGVRRGGARLVELALSRVAARAAALSTQRDAPVFERAGSWWVETGTGAVPVAEPHARPPRGAGPELG
jgi:hypothetical protein